MVGVNSQDNKSFVACANALWLYDYFLTLADEIDFLWSGRKSLILWLFVLNRYWPVCFIVWVSVELQMCGKIPWFPVFYITFATLFAQAVITLRIYAVTGNNRLIAACLSFMTFVQFAFGMYVSIRFALQSSVQVPVLPFDKRQVCLFRRWRAGEIAYIALSLLYDSSAFLVVVYSSRERGCVHASSVQTLLDNIVQGATAYFLVICTGHLLSIVFEVFAPEPIQILPANWIAVFMPLMVIRLMLSLRRAANIPDSIWSSNHPSQTESLRFAPTVVGTERGDDIALDHILSEGRIASSKGYDEN